MDMSASEKNQAINAAQNKEPMPADMKDHAHITHERSSMHHHHTHGVTSQHAGGHHLLQVENLSIGFNRYADQAGFSAIKERLDVIHDLHVSVHKGEILAVVGASGAGKTLLAQTLMGQFEVNSFVQGTVWFDGELQSAATLAKLRGKEICLVPQSIMALDPLMRVGKQLVGNRGNKKARKAKLQELFAHYDLNRDVERMYPFELSGGMARRVLLCSALIEDPKLIIADEPTPGLDIELAVKAIDDFRDFANQGGGVLLITHDIELALRVADRVAVFMDGTVVEETAVSHFSSPDTLQHPFSKALWHALPEHDFAAASAETLYFKEDTSC